MQSHHLLQDFLNVGIEGYLPFERPIIAATTVKIAQSAITVCASIGVTSSSKMPPGVARSTAQP